jgi:hypothetical protein
MVTPGVPMDPMNVTWWDNGTFGDEMLTLGNFTEDHLAPISIVTVMSLVDMGYAVNPDMADDYMPPMPDPPPPMPASSFMPPLPVAAPVGSSSSSASTKSPGATSTSKSTVPSTTVDVGNPPDTVDVALLDFDWDELEDAKNGIYEFDYWRLQAV